MLKFFLLIFFYFIVLGAFEKYHGLYLFEFQLVMNTKMIFMSFNERNFPWLHYLIFPIYRVQSVSRTSIGRYAIHAFSTKINFAFLGRTLHPTNICLEVNSRNEVKHPKTCAYGE